MRKRWHACACIIMVMAMKSVLYKSSDSYHTAYMICIISYAYICSDGIICFHYEYNFCGLVVTVKKKLAMKFFSPAVLARQYWSSLQSSGDDYQVTRWELKSSHCRAYPKVEHSTDDRQIPFQSVVPWAWPGSWGHPSEVGGGEWHQDCDTNVSCPIA